MAGGGHNSITRPHLLITAPQQHTASNLHYSPLCKVILCNDGGCKLHDNYVCQSDQIMVPTSVQYISWIKLGFEESCCIKAPFQKTIISKTKNLKSDIASLRLWPISYFKRPPAIHKIEELTLNRCVKWNEYRNFTM